MALWQNSLTANRKYLHFTPRHAIILNVKESLSREVNMLANIRSAKKRARQNVKLKAHNVAIQSRIKTATRRFEAAVDAHDFETAEAALKRVTVLLDKAAGKGIVHKNFAARKKSRLAKRYNRAQQAG
jgi:small subunit ribosomal protein S20